MPDTARPTEASSRVTRMGVDIVKARLPRLQQVVEFEVRLVVLVVSMTVWGRGELTYARIHV